MDATNCFLKPRPRSQSARRRRDQGAAPRRCKLHLLAHGDEASTVLHDASLWLHLVGNHLEEWDLVSLQVRDVDRVKGRVVDVVA